MPQKPLPDRNLDALLAMLDELDATEVTVGINEDEGSKMKATPEMKQGEHTVAQVAFWNETGTHKPDGRTHIPARPAFRQQMDDHSTIAGAAEKMAHTLFQAVTDGQIDPSVGSRALLRVGEDIGHALANRINDFTTPANAPSTIAKKGRDDPLVDTGEERDSISAVSWVRGTRRDKTSTRPR